MVVVKSLFKVQYMVLVLILSIICNFVLRVIFFKMLTPVVSKSLINHMMQYWETMWK